MNIMNMSATCHREHKRSSVWSEVNHYLVEWRKRVLIRHQLMALSDRDLSDMGLTRLNAFYESTKPFWQE